MVYKGLVGLNMRLLALVLAGGSGGYGQCLAQQQMTANVAASATQAQGIEAPRGVRYCNQQSILVRYRWTGNAPRGVQMWISLDGEKWLPWAWSDKPAEPFAFTPPRQGRVLLALAPADRETSTLPDHDYQALMIVFDWEKPLLRIISTELSIAKGNTCVRLGWAAWDESLGERPISLHWRGSAQEPWRQAVTDLPNSGMYEWNVPSELVGKTIDLSVRAGDLAGNMSEASVDIALKAPALEIATAEPVEPSTPALQAASTQASATQEIAPSTSLEPTAAAEEAERLCEIAQQHLAQSEFDMAEDMFRQAVTADPTYHAARLNLGILLQRRSRHAEAIGEYQAVLALKPDNVTSWRNLALAYMSTKDYPRARVTLQKLLAIEGDNPQTWVDLGDVEMLMGRSETARQCWEKARSLSKPNTDTAARAAKRLSVYVHTK